MIGDLHEDSSDEDQSEEAKAISSLVKAIYLLIFVTSFAIVSSACFFCVLGMNALRREKE